MIRPSTTPLVLASSAVLLALSGTSCSSSSDTTPPSGPDTTAPSVSGVVQNRTLDPTGETLAVTFSEAVTAVTAEIAGNYTLVGGANVTSATLRPNGTTVDLVLDALAIPGTATVTVSAGIEDAAGNASVLTAGQAITSSDTSAPGAATITGDAVAGLENDEITVMFDDNMIPAEVEALSSWTIESPVGMTFDITGATVSYTEMTRTAVVTLGAASADQNLQTGAAIAATFTTMRDVGGNMIAATTIGVDAVANTVIGDVAAPTLFSIAPTAGNKAIFTFSEEVFQMETADLLASTPIVGTDIVLTDASDPGVAATGSVTLSGTVVDGDSVTINDGATTVSFEFDYGATGSVAFAGLPNDADTVTISDGVTAVEFEFDDGGGTAGPGTPVLLGANPDATAANLLTAVNGDAFNVTATVGTLNSIVALRNDATGAAGNTLIAGPGGNVTVADMTGGGVAVGATAVAVDTMSFAATSLNLTAAVDADGFGVSAAGGGAGETLLTNDTAGTAGNTTITESDSGGAIAFTNMTGGLQPGTATYSPTLSTTSVVSGSLFQAEVTFAIQPAAGDTVRLFGATDPAGNQSFPVLAEPVVAAVATEPSLSTGVSTVIIATGEENDVITAAFTAPIHPRSAVDPANFSLSDGATAVPMIGATFEQTSDDEVQIRLGADNVQAADTYTLSVSGMHSYQGVEMTAPDDDNGIAPTGDAMAPSLGASDARLDAMNPNDLILTFDESISASGGVSLGNYTIAGRTTTAAAFITPRVVRLTFDTAPVLAENVMVESAAMTDLAGNAAIGTANVAITAADTTAPTAVTVTGTTHPMSADVITVEFDEPMIPAQAVTASNYGVTLDGGAVSLTGATLSYNSVASTVTIALDSAITLANGGTLSVTPSGVADAAGNDIVIAPTAATVAGDASAPVAATGFVNLRANELGTTIDVDFGEHMDPAAANVTANWSSSGGQMVASAMAMESGRVRVTFAAALAAGDTVTAAGLTDLAGNVAGNLTFNPVE